MSDPLSPLTHAVTAALRVHAPDWTDGNQHDPGLTLLEVIAYLADRVAGQEAPSEARSSAAVRAIRSLEALVEPSVPPATRTNAFEHWSRIRRPNYFFAKVMTADDFLEEQQYHVAKYRRHLQMMHGWGVARGLDVSVAADGLTISVEHGMAIDPLGREIVLEGTTTITPAPGATSPAWLVVEYAERGVDPVPLPGAEPLASRTEEGCRVIVADASCDSGVAIARLLEDAAGWRVDDTFSPARAR